jgi:GNAT superfamily N-acetyltransferase
MSHHLAQVNIAKLLAPIDSPQIADFYNALDEVNALAEASPGFVWRLVGDGNDATSLRPFDDPDTILNMSVWESPEQLKTYVYRGLHVEFFKRRHEWFHTTDRAVAAWWVNAGQIPTIDDAKIRSSFLAQYGPTPYAFNVGSPLAKLTIDPTDLSDPVAQQLIERLDTELNTRSDVSHNFFHLGADETAQGRGVFLVARLDGEPVGCGATRLIADDTAEIKRMFVGPDARGMKVGQAILHELESHARRLGATRAALETGLVETHPEAQAIYRRAGYVEIPCWGEYAESPISVCFGKTLV